MNLFRSENYIPGDNESGPWVIEEKKEYDNSAFISSDGYVKGYLGERYVWFDKYNKVFIDSLKRRAVEHSKGASTNFAGLPDKAVMKVIVTNNGEKVETGDHLQQQFLNEIDNGQKSDRFNKIIKKSRKKCKMQQDLNINDDKKKCKTFHDSVKVSVSNSKQVKLVSTSI